MLEALAGSTNALIHLIAIAGRVGVRLTLEDFQAAEGIPVLANIEPTGSYLMEDFYFAGGVQAVINELLPHLHGDAPDGQRPHDRGERGREPVVEPRRDPAAELAAAAAQLARRPARFARPERAQ